MPRPCAVEAHARGYKLAQTIALQMPRPCAVEAHARGYKLAQTIALQMPRPCAVEAHARGYKLAQTIALQMPRPCAVASQTVLGSFCSSERETPRRKAVASKIRAFTKALRAR